LNRHFKKKHQHFLEKVESNIFRNVAPTFFTKLLINILFLKINIFNLHELMRRWREGWRVSRQWRTRQRLAESKGGRSRRERVGWPASEALRHPRAREGGRGD
jgi:hypothetical protein